MKPIVLLLCLGVYLGRIAASEAPPSSATSESATWTFAVSGDSRNCGDFVMPAIAASVKAEGDAFYWHLGDFRAIYTQDEDFVSMESPALNKISPAEYDEVAWDDFLAHQIAPFGDLPVFLGRGNHETIAPMTRDRFTAKFSAFLNRPEIVAQNRADNLAKYSSASPGSSPWYHFVRNGVDFITLDNSNTDEFSNDQLTWLRGVLARDMAPESGITTLIAGMHEALPHSTSSGHSMDDWYNGTESGELVYRWFLNAHKAGKHVYLLASHSHFYSPNVYDTSFWQKEGTVLPGIIIGSAGAQRYVIPPTADQVHSKTDIYAYLRATVHQDGKVDFSLEKIDADKILAVKWPNAPLSQVQWCIDHNTLTSDPKKNPPPFAP
jgi:hypothetical protein